MSNWKKNLEDKLTIIEGLDKDSLVMHSDSLLNEVFEILENAVISENESLTSILSHLDLFDKLPEEEFIKKINEALDNNDKELFNILVLSQNQ